MFIRLFCVHLLLPLCRKAFLYLHEKRATDATRSTRHVMYYSKKDRGADMRIIPLHKNESYISYFFLKKEMDILTSTRVSIQDKIVRIQKNTYAPIQLHLQWKKDDEEWD